MPYANAKSSSNDEMVGTEWVPVLGVETEADPFATIAKILQGGIIGMAVFLIPSTVRIPEKMPKIYR